MPAPPHPQMDGSSDCSKCRHRNCVLKRFEGQLYCTNCGPVVDAKNERNGALSGLAIDIGECAGSLHYKGFKLIRSFELSKMVLEDELAHFTGTEQYYRNLTGLLFTDGIKYLADRANCYWLIDLVGSYQPRLGNIPFQLWQLKVNDDKSALVTMVEDTGQPIKVRQAIPYTDFPLKDFTFYCVDKVMMLKSEY